MVVVGFAVAVVMELACTVCVATVEGMTRLSDEEKMTLSPPLTRMSDE